MPSKWTRFCFFLSFVNTLFSQLSSSLPGAEWAVVLLHCRVHAAAQHTVWAGGGGGGRPAPQSHPAVAQTPQRLLQQGGSDSLLQQPPDLLAGVNRSHQVTTGNPVSKGYHVLSDFFAYPIISNQISWFHFQLDLRSTRKHQHWPGCCFAHIAFLFSLSLCFTHIAPFSLFSARVIFPKPARRCWMPSRGWTVTFPWRLR